MPDLPPRLSKVKWWEWPLTPCEYVRQLKSERQVSVWDFMRCLDTWALVYKTHDPKLKDERRQFLEHWIYIRRKIEGSNLLMRLFEGDEVRRTPCPKHIKTSHFEKPNCDCNGIGWLPRESDQLTLFDLGRRRKWQ